MKKIIDLIRYLTTKDNLAAKWIILSIFVLLTALMFPKGLSIESDYPIGIIWTEEEVFAPFAFPIYKDEREYEREREQAAAKVYKVFEENPSIAQLNIDSLRQFFILLQKIIDRKPEDKQVIDAALKSFPLPLRESEWQTLWRLRNVGSNSRASAYSFNKLRRDVLLVVNGLYLQGIVDVRKSQSKENELIAKRKKNVEQIVPLSKFLDVVELGKTVQQTFITGYKGENDTVSVATKIALLFLAPNVIYQKEQTEREIQYAVDLVPRTVGAVSEGERIIAKKERITPEIKLKLDSLRKAKQERGAGINQYVTFSGKVLHVFAIMWILSMYLYLFRKKIYHDNAKLLLIILVYLAVAVLAYLTVVLEAPVQLRYLILVPAASMLLGIIFDSRVAFYSTVVISLLVAGIRGNDYGIAFASLVAGSFSMYTVRDIKKRTQIFRSIVYIFLGYAAAILALGLERYESVEIVGSQLFIASINAVLSPLITYGLLLFIERIFKVSTDLTLMDLSDLNNPLLKELSQKAPGTFHHSVSVATLAASAADAVGANSTLVYVGALYHDIGKMVNSELFVENQLGTENRHRTMSPRKSARVIAGHVEDGVKLAQEHRLPHNVVDFIPMHHGTMHIGFFYEKALRQKKYRMEIDENDYRYPGPRPNTKETGIVLLADGIEASTRAIEEPTVEKMEANIDSLIKLRLLEGELDESTLTMRDLTRIKESFLKTLIGVHHARLRYPVAKPAPQKEAPEPQPEETQQMEETEPEKTPEESAEKRLQRTIDNIDL